MQTVTTVGYGDVTPENVAGRFVAGAVMLAGVALLAIVTPAVTSSFAARVQELRGAEDATEDDVAEQRLDARLHDITARLERLERMLGALSEACWAAGARIWPSSRWNANASSSPRHTSLRPPSASATSRTAFPTGRNGRPNGAYSASAPLSSTRSCRAAAASSPPRT